MATTIRQAISVIKNSRLHVCVNSFSEIITNYYKMPTVVLYASTDPHLVGYLNNTNLVFDKLVCWPCFSGRKSPRSCAINDGANIPCMDFGVDEVFEVCIRCIKNNKL